MTTLEMNDLGGSKNTYNYDASERLIAQPKKKVNKHKWYRLPWASEDFTRIFTFEFIGTSFLAYGALACEGNPIKLAIFFFLAIVMAGPFSGAHINPAVTLAFFLKKKGGIPKNDAKCYVFGQLLGAFTGGLFGYMILGEVDSPFVPRQEMKWMMADFLGEILGSFFFIIFIHIQCDPKTAIAKEPLLGFALITMALMGGRQYTRHSGGCLNPGLAVGLNIFVGIKTIEWERFGTLWIVVLGPLCGGALSTYFYELVYRPYLKKDEPAKQNQQQVQQV